jgi:hypothetical protein
MCTEKCNKLDTLYSYKTDIELLKLHVSQLTNDLNELNKKLAMNNKLLITSLTGIIIGLIGIIAIFIK